jgi:hypothetical protein
VAVTIRVNVDTTGLEEARSAANRAEELCENGFDHASEVRVELDKVITGIEVFKDAFRAALDGAHD